MSEIEEKDNIVSAQHISEQLAEGRTSVLVEDESSSEAVTRRPERHHRKPDAPKGGFYKMRQIFNIIFMIGAVIGAIVYLKNEMMGAVIIVTAMAFKMAECVLRFKK